MFILFWFCIFKVFSPVNMFKTIFTFNQHFNRLPYTKAWRPLSESGFAAQSVMQHLTQNILKAQEFTQPQQQKYS